VAVTPSARDTTGVFITGVKQETCTFNPHPTYLSDFEFVDGSAVTAVLGGTATEVEGLAVRLRELGVAPEFGPMAWAPSGGPVQPEAWAQLASCILDAVERSSAAGFAVVLHGSMVTAHDEDPDGWLLAEIRRRIGDRPLVATVDLHAVLTDRMLRSANAIVPYHTYPHTDYVETGRRAADVLHRALQAPLATTTALVRVPMLVRGDELLTRTGRYGRLIDECRQLETNGTALAAGVLIGNPFTDVTDLCSSVLVTTPDDELEATRHAQFLAQRLWSDRAMFQAALTPLASLGDAIEYGRITLISDQADATSSGASGDSVSVLRELLAIRPMVRAVVPVVDAPAVTLAMALGVGANASFRLGGTVDHRNSQITVDATVVSLFPSSVVHYEDGTAGRCGDVAVLRCGDVSILATSERPWFVGRNIFLAHGLDPSQAEVIVVKSPNGFRTHYESMVDRIVTADGEGSTTANLARLPYQRVLRPIYPLDDFQRPSLTTTVFRLTT